MMESGKSYDYMHVFYIHIFMMDIEYFIIILN